MEINVYNFNDVELIGSTRQPKPTGKVKPKSKNKKKPSKRRY